MHAVTAAQMRTLDLKAIERGIPGTVLMERAGRGVAEAIREELSLGGSVSLVRFLAGPGNNGGDAFAAARWLREHGVPDEVWIAASGNDLRGDAWEHFNRMRAAGVPYRELPRDSDWDSLPVPPRRREVLLVDGLLGTGARGTPRGSVAAAIRYLRRCRSQCRILAIDLPSGLDADTGEAAGEETVPADVTVTMALPKIGLLQPRAVEYVGRLRVVDIGLPAELLIDLRGDVEWIAPFEMESLLSPRPRASHKGTFGHALLIGGATGYAGALIHAARAAAHSGAGLVSALVPETIFPSVAVAVPEAMVHPVPATSSGSLSVAGLTSRTMDLGSRFQAVLVGPGLTSHPDSSKIVRDLLDAVPVPLVVDADGLNVLGRLSCPLRRSGAPLVLTPHPGEMARLLGLESAAQVQADRFAAAREAAGRSGAVVILKGAGTLVAEPSGHLWVNLTGNPGLATGGTGDVLAGLLTGLLAQGFAPVDAARLAVYVHGRAADRAAACQTEVALTATDVIRHLPAAFRELVPR